MVMMTGLSSYVTFWIQDKSPDVIVLDESKMGEK